MSHDPHPELVYLTVIAGRKKRDALLEAVTQAGGRQILTMYGKGSACPNYLKEMLGLVAEENKIIIMCLMSSEKASAMYQMLEQKFNFNKPNTGIAFTIPVERLSF